MTECWFRNPRDYIRELVEVGAYWLAWDRGTLLKYKIDPISFAELYYSKTYPWRMLLVGEQGTAELRPGASMARPTAVYPTWAYGDETALLEEVVTQPIGEDIDLCTTDECAPDERPVYGQEHRVVITNAPSASTGPGRRFLTYLKELQEDNPECIIHLHGAYSWRVAFGQGFGSADVQPRVTAQKGKVSLPSGREVKYEEVQKNPKWVTALGFKPVDLKIPRNRCMFNIKSAMWAAENYRNLFALPASRGITTRVPVDLETPDASYKPPEAKTIVTKKPSDGDKHICDSCSLALSCSYFRAGAVCSVPGAEPKPLAEYFNTRDSDQIISGLGILLQAQTRRLERGLREEEIEGIHPEVTKLINSLFDRGVALAKLVNPALRKPELAINVGPGGMAAVVTGSNPRTLMASVVRALEERGVPRDKITPDMVANLLESMRNQAKIPHAIEGTVTSVQDERVV